MSYRKTKQFPRNSARAAGLLYLIIAVTGAFSIGYVPSVLFVFGDAAETAKNVASNMALFKWGILADIIVIYCEVVLTAILYNLLKSVDNTLSLTAAFARLGMVVVMALNLINYLVPLILIEGNGYLETFTPEQLQTLAMLFLDAHEFGVYVWQIFFSLHLAILGYLVFRSGFLPRILGVMMAVGSAGYALQALEKFVGISSEFLSIAIIGFLVIVTIAELGFAFWLLIKGLNKSGWQKLSEANAGA